MKNALPVLTAALILFMCAGLSAGEISIYKDKDGVINLTDKPAPPDARVQDVIRYRQKSTAELKQQQRQDEESRQKLRSQQDAQRARGLSDNAEKARKEAHKSFIEDTVFANKVLYFINDQQFIF